MPASAGAAFASSSSFLGCCLLLQHSKHAKTMRRPVTASQAAERELSAGPRQLETYNTKELTSLLFAYGQLARWEVETKGEDGAEGPGCWLAAAVEGLAMQASPKQAVQDSRTARYIACATSISRLASFPHKRGLRCVLDCLQAAPSSGAAVQLRPGG